MIEKHKIVEILEKHFAYTSDVKESQVENDIQDWLSSSVESWVSEGKVISFYPFDIFFSAKDDAVFILSSIGENLSKEKTKKLKFSPYKMFVRALIFLLSKKNFYIDNRKAWSFILQVIKEMRINEAIPILARLINLEEFRNIYNEDGYDFFIESFETIVSFGPSDDAKVFYETAIEYVDKYPGISLRLLEKLLEIEPEKSMEIINNMHMKKAIKTYVNDLYRARGVTKNINIPLINKFAKKYDKLLIKDEHFIDFFKACSSNYFHYLILKSRVEELCSTNVENENIRQDDVPKKINGDTPRVYTQENRESQIA